MARRFCGSSRVVDPLSARCYSWVRAEFGLLFLGLVQVPKCSLLDPSWGAFRYYQGYKTINPPLLFWQTVQISYSYFLKSKNPCYFEMFTIPTRLSQLFWQSHYSNIFWSTIPTQYYSDRTVWGGCSKLRHYSNMFTIPTFSSILFWQIIISTIPRTIPWTPKCGNLPCVAASYCARSTPKNFDYIGAHLLFRHWFLILFLRSHYSYISRM